MLSARPAAGAVGVDAYVLVADVDLDVVVISGMISSEANDVCRLP